MGSPTRRTPVQTTPVAVPILPQVNTGKASAPIAPRGGASKRKVEQATIMRQGEGAAALGIGRGTLNEWKQKGCPGIDASGVNLGKVLAWREEQARLEGAEVERMNSVLTGSLTKGEIETEIKYHELLEVTENTGRRRGIFMPVASATGNQSVMLGRMMSIIRMLPDTLDEELELAMSCTCGGCSIKRAERRAIVRSSCDTLAEILQSDRIVRGFEDDVPDDFERFAADLQSEDEDDVKATAVSKANQEAAKMAKFLADDE